MEDKKLEKPEKGLEGRIDVPVKEDVEDKRRYFEQYEVVGGIPHIKESMIVYGE